jgi:Flp pilus assembly pilin Flp
LTLAPDPNPDHDELKPEGMTMRTRILQLLRDRSGQDLIEYALITATIAIVVAGFLPPSLMPSVDTIFSKITSSMALS